MNDEGRVTVDVNGIPISIRHRPDVAELLRFRQMLLSGRLAAVLLKRRT